jgi:hypothetical protein
LYNSNPILAPYPTIPNRTQSYPFVLNRDKLSTVEGTVQVGCIKREFRITLNIIKPKYLKTSAAIYFFVEKAINKINLEKDFTRGKLRLRF